MQIKNRILLFFKPLQIWLQRQGRRETLMSGMHVNLISKLIKEGDIILSYESQRWTSFFIRGNFDHAVIVTVNKTIMESVGDQYENCQNIGGVREVDLTEWLYKKDHVCIIRPTLNNPLTNLQASINAYKYKGFSYDYGFSRGGEFIYCSELPYLCYSSEDVTFMDILPDNKEILPIQYLEMTKIQPYRFSLIYNTRG